jgi:Pilus formation protein N terminal region
MQLRCGLIALGTLAFATIVGSITQAEELRLRPEGFGKVIELHLGIAQFLPIPKPIRSVILGDPNVVDVTVQSDSMVVFTPKATGSTNVIILGENKEIIFSAVLVIPRQIGLVRVQPHGRTRDALHDEYLYNCTPVCVRVQDQPLSITAQAALQRNPIPIEVEQAPAPQVPVPQTTTSE